MCIIIRPQFITLAFWVMVSISKELQYSTSLLKGLVNLKSSCTLSGWDSITEKNMQSILVKKKKKYTDNNIWFHS